MIAKDTKFLIVGLGLMGGSYARALTRKGFFVGGVDCQKQAVDYALSNRIIKTGVTDEGLNPEFINQFDIIVFALYPHIFFDWIEKNQKYIKPGAILTDVTGVKGSVVYKIQDMLRDDIEFIGAHPMAGKEVSGIENSSEDIFNDANYIVTPTEKNSSSTILLCEELGKALGFKTVTRLSPEKHDEMIGFLSQLTHCIAVSLMVCKDSKHLVDYTGNSFRDLTRIAKINDSMWTELFLMNKDELIKNMDLFAKNFKELRDSIASEDTETMKKIMQLSTQRRNYFDEKE